MTKKISNIHDKFFRSMMNHSQVAREFFEKHLPDKIKKIIDLNSLDLKSGSFVDEELKLQVTDMLYSADFNGSPGYLYLLIEHQSTPLKLMPLRILKYMISIMENHSEMTNSDILPVVFPIIFYTGRSPYKYSTYLFDLFGDLGNLAKQFLFDKYRLIDLIKEYFYPQL